LNGGDEGLRVGAWGVVNDLVQGGCDCGVMRKRNGKKAGAKGRTRINGKILVKTLHRLN
jgi:hypothetical protein